MVYNELEQGDILSEVRVGLASIAYTDISLRSIWAIYKIRQTPVGTLHQRPTKAYFFDFFRAYPVMGNVCNPVFWPDKLVDFLVPDCIAGNPPRQCKRRTSWPFSGVGPSVSENHVRCNGGFGSVVSESS